jgi:hypothetical protein
LPTANGKAAYRLAFATINRQTPTPNIAPPIRMPNRGSPIHGEICHGAGVYTLARPALHPKWQIRKLANPN